MYKINGYDLYLAFGIVPDADMTTANSFEKPQEPVEVFSHTWENGFVEYDLSAPVQFKPRVFTIKGTLIVGTLADYKATKLAINTILYENYVTLEMESMGVKVNAKIKSVPVWDRITSLNGKIAVSVSIQFDEVLQPMPFKDNGTLNITYLVDGQSRIYTTQDNKSMII